MMSSWRSSPRPKIPLLFNRTCVNVSRTLHGFVLAASLFSVTLPVDHWQSHEHSYHVSDTSVSSQLQFQSDLLITHMYSGEGEEVKLSLPVNPTGNVEDWLREVEKSMKATLRDNIDRSLKVYPEVCNLESYFTHLMVVFRFVTFKYF